MGGTSAIAANIPTSGPFSGRAFVLAAATLWSTSGAFVKAIDLAPTTIAMYRALFAGLALVVLALAWRAKFTWDRRMLLMVGCFAAMNYLFIASMTRTTAANTIFLQYTAPGWMFAAGVLWLGEKADRANVLALAGAMVGIAILIAGGWREGIDNRIGMLMGLGSGVAYAGVAVSMRFLRAHDPIWLAATNLLGAGILLALGTTVADACLGPIDLTWTRSLMVNDLAGLALFGIFQMALPYVLFGIGLRTVAAQEAGLLTLLEPILNPVWTYLVAGERPSALTITGGTIVIATLVARYLPAMRPPRKGAA